MPSLSHNIFQQTKVDNYKYFQAFILSSNQSDSCYKFQIPGTFTANETLRNVTVHFLNLTERNETILYDRPFTNKTNITKGLEFHYLNMIVEKIVNIKSWCPVCAPAVPAP